MTFHRINEDPTYDDDGNCVDEDYIDPAEWDQAFPKDSWRTVDTSIPEEEMAEIRRNAPEACYVMDCDPYSTINS